tara:strand:+ start:158 stop:403 length:246 start_codon:yes stop_codon:yes gene_type:complete
MVPPKKSTAEATISTPAAELTLRWLSAKTSSASARMDRINLKISSWRGGANFVMRYFPFGRIEHFYSTASARSLDFADIFI